MISVPLIARVSKRVLINRHTLGSVRHRRGLTVNTNPAQAFGVNVISGVTLKNQSLNESLKENTISFGFSSFSQLRGLSSEPLSGFSNSIFTDQMKRLEEYKIERKNDEK